MQFVSIRPPGPDVSCLSAGRFTDRFMVVSYAGGGLVATANQGTNPADSKRYKRVVK